MKRLSMRRPITIIMLVLMAAGLVFGSGCDIGWMFLDAWMEANHLTYAELVGDQLLGRYNPLGSDKDPVAAAALEVKNAAMSIYEGDKKMEEGRKKRDAKAMDEAIKLRPEDYSYRVSRYVLAVEQFDMKTAELHRNKGVDSTVENAVSYRRFLDQQIRELEDLENRLYGRYKSKEHECALYQQLKTNYSLRSRDYELPADKAQLETYRRLAAAAGCSG